MTELSELILSKYQVRKTRKQKTEFIELLKEHLSDHTVTIESGGFTRSRNIVVGDVEILSLYFLFRTFLLPKTC